MDLSRACAATGEGNGLIAADHLQSIGVPTSASRGTFNIKAPSQSSVAAIEYLRYLRRHSDSGDWFIGLRNALGEPLDTCAAAPDCTSGDPADGALVSESGLDTPSLSFGVWCAPTPPANSCDSGENFHRAYAALYSATVTISDPIAPTGVGLSGVPAAWTSLSPTVQVAAADNVSVSSRTVRVDGNEVGRTDAVCDYSQTEPCAKTGSADVVVDLSGLADGAHQIQAVAFDPGGEFGSSAVQTLKVDRHAPVAPEVSLEGGRFAGATPRTLNATLPGSQAAPVTAVRSQACATTGGTCEAVQTTAVPANATAQAISVTPPGTDGDYEVRMWLVDAAGNEDSTNRATAMISRDTTPPDAGLQMAQAGDVPAGTTVNGTPVASDAGSGVATKVLQVSVDGGAFADAAGPTVVEAGRTYDFRTAAADAVGNAAVSSTVRVRGVAPPVVVPPAMTTATTAPVVTPPAPVSPALKITKARRTSPRVVVVSGKLATMADGAAVRASLRVRDPRTRKLRTVTATGRARRGAFSLRLRLPDSFAGGARLPSSQRVVVTVATTTRTLAARASARPR